MIFRIDFLRQPAGRPDRYQQPQDFINKQCNFSSGRLPAVPIRILLALVHMHKQCNISSGPSAVRYQTIPSGDGGPLTYDPAARKQIQTIPSGGGAADLCPLSILFGKCVFFAFVLECVVSPK